MVSSSEDLSESWHSAHKVLQSALTISQASACRNHQLESDILYCKGDQWNKVVWKQNSLLSSVNVNAVFQLRS